MLKFMVAMVVALALPVPQQMQQRHWQAQLGAAAPSWNVSTATKYVLYAYAAYNKPTVGAWTCPYCVQATNGFVPTVTCTAAKTGAFAYVGYNVNNREIVASFRGSDNIQNWILDFEFFKTPPNTTFPGLSRLVQVEEGFWKYYESVRTCVVNEVVTLHAKYPGFKLGITGHSLGAAAAGLCAVDLVVNHGVLTSVLEAITFGETRVGNAAYASTIKATVPGKIRVTDHKDIVPHLPPKEFGYRHGAWEVYETTAGGSTFIVCNGTGEDPKCSDQWGDVAGLLNIDDHLKYMGVPCCDRP